MGWLIIGCLGFLLFIVYDINQIYFNMKLLKSFFLIGCILVATCTIVISRMGEDIFYVSNIVRAFFALFSILFLILLVYTLFFAVPFKQTYIEGSKQKIYTEGVYALCRHPGVLWFFGFYLFFSLFLGNFTMLYATVIFSMLNIVYVIIQDRIVFPKLFDGYDEYKEKVPFLIPSVESIKKCLSYFTNKQSKEGLF